MHLEPDTWLITYNLTSIYTSMTAMGFVQSAAKALTRLKLKIPKFEYLVDVLGMLLENNDIEFYGHLCKEILGASMGAVFSIDLWR